MKTSKQAAQAGFSRPGATSAMGSASMQRGMRTQCKRLTASISFFLAGSCWAALGGNLASVTSDQQAFGASDVATQVSGATLHTQTLTNGVTIRQYLDSAGNVFAVAWEGPVLPDFQRLLASHFAVYEDAVRQQRRGVNLQTAELVIESGGMMRSFTGRAYLPYKVPAAIRAADIR